MIPFYIKSELFHCPYSLNKDTGLAYGTLQFRESAGPIVNNGMDFDIDMDMDFINDLANTGIPFIYIHCDASDSYIPSIHNSQHNLSTHPLSSAVPIQPWPTMHVCRSESKVPLIRRWRPETNQ